MEGFNTFYSGLMNLAIFLLVAIAFIFILRISAYAAEIWLDKKLIRDKQYSSKQCKLYDSGYRFFLSIETFDGESIIILEEKEHRFPTITKKFQYQLGLRYYNLLRRAAKERVLVEYLNDINKGH